MFDDPIVAEVRKAREEILESYGGDFDAMMGDMMKRQFESGHEVVRPVPGKATASGGAELAANSRVHEYPSKYAEETPIFDDPIVAEVRKAREEILESYGGDSEAMMCDMMKRQEERKKKFTDSAAEVANSKATPVELRETPPLSSE